MKRVMTGGWLNFFFKKRMLSGGAEGSILLWDLERAEDTTRGGGEVVHRPVRGTGKYVFPVQPVSRSFSFFFPIRDWAKENVMVCPGRRPRISSA